MTTPKQSLYSHDSPQARFQRDPAFSSLVQMLQSFLHRHEFSPTELREAVMLAATRYEMTVCRPMFVMSDGEIREFMRRTDVDPGEELERMKFIEDLMREPVKAVEHLYQKERNGHER